MRNLCKEIGVFTPYYNVVKSEAEAKKITKKIKYPLILKPIENQSSQGVFKIDNDKQLSYFFPLTLKHKRNHNSILIEKFIEGEEYTVEGFKVYDKHHCLAISKKTHFSGFPTIASSLLYQPLNQNGIFKNLIKQNDLFIEKSKLPFGITHAEYKYMDGKFYMIEVAARGGGSKISSHIVPIVSGVDVNKKLINLALGKKIKTIKVKGTGYFVLLHFFNFKPGYVLKRTSEDFINSFNFVVDFEYGFNLKDILKNITSDSNRHAYVIIKSKIKEELELNLNIIKNLIKLKYD
jgi:biotin carboxylase